jgi:PAS domain S-box-containing protein
MMTLVNFSSFVPPDWVGAALVLSLICVSVLVALFYYLNYRTRKVYFSLWTVAWMFYAVYLAAAIGLQESPNQPWLVMVRRACIGLAALFMSWGSFQLANRPRPWRELKGGIVLILLWSALAAFVVRDRLWITVPVFMLLAMAGVYTGVTYFRARQQYRSANLLAWGFLLWGLHLVAYPFMDYSAAVATVCYLVSAVLAVVIAVGMVVEQEVNLAEQNYRQLFDAATDAIFLVDMMSLHVLEANKAALALSRRAGVQLVGSNFLNFCPALADRDTGQIDKGKLLQAVVKPYNEFQFQCADGAVLTCEGELNVVQWQQRSAFQICVRDVTERKEIGQQLQRAEKLSALGQLVAGVAHELNNPLAVVMGYAQVLSKRSGVDPKTRADIGRMQRETERAATIVRDLLAFARPGEPRKTAINLGTLVQNVVESRLADITAAGLELQISRRNDLPRTQADGRQIEQVLDNIISNAIQALETVPGPRHLKVSLEANELFLRVSVADNGPGIPSAVIGRVFDPFFTTKSPGKGTGLGLTIANTIAREHRGKISVESDPRHGTVFHLDLPILPCHETAEPVPSDRTPSDGTDRSGYRLLLVDDEPGILEVLRDVLAGNGYQVDTASNGVDAMNRLGSGRYDLMVSDLRMPDMDGEALYRALREQHPHLAGKIVFLTGDTVSAGSRAFLESTGNRWLSKPFNIVEVERVVRACLDGPSSPHGSN